MKVLITGASGFVGTNLVLYLRELGFEVLTLDTLTNYNFAVDFPYRLGSFQKDNNIDKCGATRIIHLASQSHVDRAISGPQKFIDDNVSGTVELFEIAKRMPEVQSITLFSTDEVGACLEEGKFYEDGPINPQNTYAATKACQEHLATSYIKAFSLPIITTRCVNIFGPHQASEKFIPTVISKALQGEKVPLYGDGKQTREWVHVDHVCEFLHFILHATFIPPGTKLHITGEQGMQNIHLAYILLSMLGKSRDLISFVEDRPGHDVRYSLGRSNATDAFGLPFYRRNFMSDLEKTVTWYEENHGKH